MIMSTSKAASSMKIASVYGVFAAAALATYHLVAEGAVSSLLTVSAMVQCLGITFLCMQVVSSGTASGVSAGSLKLDALAIIFRLSSTLWLDGYLPVDKSGDHLYQAVDMSCLVLIAWLLRQVLSTNGHTYQAHEDSFPICPTVVICLGLAALFHADMDAYPLFDTFWMTGLFLGVVAVLPQLWLITQNCSQVQALTSHYMAALALSRILSGVFMWLARDFITCSRWFESINHGIWAILAAHAVHLLLLGDFAYYYVRAIVQNGVRAPVELSAEVWV